MAPNLVVATKTLFSPHKWFNPTPCIKSERKTEHWDEPVPGTYQYIPGRGWSLIAIDSPSATLDRPIPVKYSQVLKRDLLVDEYNDRKRIADVRSSSGKVKSLGFFRLDDGIAYVNYLDANGDFIPGPYKLYCIDDKTGKFRDMLKGDDPGWRSRQSSRAPSISHSHCNACASHSMECLELPRKGSSAPMSPWATTPVPSRPASIRLASFSSSTPSSNPESRDSRSRKSSATPPTTAPTSPGETLNDPTELARRLSAIKALPRPT